MFRFVLAVHICHFLSLTIATQNARIDFWVYEEQPINSLVGTIEPLAPNSSIEKIEVGGVRLVQYKVFNLDLSSKELRNAIVIDREAIEFSFYELLILSEDGNTLTVVVNIMDLNDNAPQVGIETRLQFTISEDESPGFLIGLPPASDPDSGTNGLSRESFSLTGDVETFGLVVAATSQGKYSVSLKLEEDIDREMRDSYELVLHVRDGDTGAETSDFTSVQLDISLVVSDVNDNAPIFDNSDYYVELKMPVDAGEVLVEVNALDVDSGDNGRVTYLMESTSEEIVNSFFVHSETGLVELIQAKTANTNFSNTITIAAKDSGNPSQKSQCRVHVLFYSYNAHSPLIAVDGSIANFTDFVAVPDDTDVGHVVCSVSCSDDDVTAVGGVSLFVIDADKSEDYPFSADKVSSNLFDVVLDMSVDARIHSRYSMKFICFDNGNPIKSTVKEVTFWVTTEDGNVAQFSKEVYDASVPENVDVGSFVVQLDATVLGNDAKILYRIESGNENSWFLLNEETGLITTREQLDRELLSEVTLNVSSLNVHGNAEMNNGSYALVKIHLFDVNDNPPYFTNLPNTVSVPEDQDAGLILFTAHAIDPDEGFNGSIRFALRTEDQLAQSTFSIDSESGHVKLVGNLDRESRGSFNLTVSAIDLGEQLQLGSESFLFIVVEDVNDNAPRMYPSSYFAVVASKAQSGSEVVRVFAVDDDETGDSQIIYTIVAGNELSVFELDANTGILLLKSNEDLVNGGSFEIIVEARDEGGGGLVSSNVATVKVFVSDSNGSQNKHFEFSQPRYVFYLYENTLYHHIADVRLKNHPYVPENVEYSILEGDSENRFAIDNKTGQFGLANQVRLNYESPNAYFNLTVGAQMSDVLVTVSVEVFVMDKNDHAPKWPGSTVEVRVSELLETDGLVAKLQAVDLDSKSTVFYEISDDPHHLFYVLHDELRTLDVLTDYVGQSLTLSLSAYDNGIPSYSSTVHYKVFIEDENDNEPEFHTGPDSLFLNILESTPVGTVITSLNVSDQDSGLNSKLSFSVELVRTVPDSHSSSNSIPFGVFPNGDLYLADSVLDENLRRDIYEFQVVARDHGYPEKRSSLKLVVCVEDLNDNAPVFQKGRIEFDVSPFALKGTVIGQVSAVDKDKGRNGQVFYVPMLSTQTNLFQVEPQSGEISVSFDLANFCVRNQEFVVTAVDLGSPSLNSSVIVAIRVNGTSNDNEAKFSEKVYVVEMNENNAENQQVLYLALQNGQFASESGLEAVFRIADSGVNSNFTEDFFQLHESTGVITTKSAINRESDFQIIRFQVIVETVDNGITIFADYADVVIRILDENDNQPQWTEETINSSVFVVSESVKIGTVIGQVTAFDEDSMKSEPDIVYKISQTTISFPFAITTQGKIYSIRMLDFEVQSEYVFQIVAYNRDSPMQSISLEVKVSVLDVNDEYPEFKESESVFEVSETTKIGTLITTVEVMDRDSSSVHFSLLTISPVSQTAQLTFDIDESSGEVVLNRTLTSAFVHNLYQVMVFACDEDSLCSKRQLRIVVTEDASDCEPLPYFTTGKVQYLSSSASTTRLLFDVQAVIESNTSSVAYEVSPTHALVINSQTGSVSLRVGSSRGTPGEIWTVLVTAFDLRNPCVTTSQTLELFWLLDENLHALTLSIAGDLAVHENSLDELGIVTIEGLERHRYAQANARFDVESILCSGGTESKAGFRLPIDLVEIVQTTGGIHPGRKLDFDSMVCHKLDVTFKAYANGKVGTLSSSLEVINVNDLAPIFDYSSLMNIKIPETSSLSNFWNVTFVDSDSPAFTVLIGHSTPFSISPEGYLSLTGELDFETKNLYDLTVRVTDSEFESVESMTIEIEDVNEFPPTCRLIQSSPAPGFAYFEVTENKPSGTTVGLIEVSDLDSAQNLFSFELLNHRETFEVDTVAGAVKTKGVLDAENERFYGLHVKVCDSPDEPESSLCSVCEILVRVNNEDDNAPVVQTSTVDQTKLFFKIDENAPVGTLIAYIQIEDDDVLFNIVDGDYEDNNHLEVLDDRVYLLKKPGVNGLFGLYSREVFDREAFDPCDEVAMYQFQIYLHDTQFKYFSIWTVHLEIVNVDDNPLRIEAAHQVTVFEQFPIEIPFCAAQFVDFDRRNITEVTFRLCQENPDGVESLFSVDPQQGFLTLKTRPEQQSVLVSVCISVDDSQFEGAFEVNVAIKDSEMEKVWVEVPEMPELTVPSWAVEGAQLIDISTFVQSSTSSDVGFAFTGNEAAVNAVYLNTDSGLVSVTNHFSELSEGNHRLYFFAYNREHPHFRSSIFHLDLKVPLFFERDCILSPKFDKRVFMANESETQLPHDIGCFQLFSSQCESPVDNSILVNILDSFSGKFAVDLRDNLVCVKLMDAVDREEQKDYILQLQVSKNSDDDNFEIFSRIEVKVMLVDDDDNVPVIKRVAGSAVVDRNVLTSLGVKQNLKMVVDVSADAGSVVGIVEAADLDNLDLVSDPISFSMESRSNEDVPFAICETTGQITTTAWPLHEAVYQVAVNVWSVRDAEKADSVEFSIIVANQLRVSSSPCSLTVDTLNLAAPLSEGDFLSQVVCQEVGIQSIQWDNIEGNFVTVQPETGYITVAFDISTSGNYSAVLIYSLNGGPNNLLELSLFVTSGPVSEDSVQLNKLTLDLTEATDTDMLNIDYPQNNIIDASVIGSNCNPSFFIAEVTAGSVLVKSTKLLDFDEGCAKVSELFVMTTHEGGSCAITKISEEFQVININDHAPSCAGLDSFSQFRISEGSVEKFTFDLQIEDADSFPFNQTKPTLHSVNANSRYLQDLGVVNVSAGNLIIDSSETVLDLEQFPEVSQSAIEAPLLFLIQVKDADSDDLESTCFLEIVVSDVNEFAPSCYLESIGNQVEVAENLDIGSIVGTVKCEDQDTSSGPGYLFSLLEGESAFSLDQNSGVLTSVVGFDFEREQTYQVSIAVGNGGLETSFVASIFVVNSNDEYPILNPIGSITVMDSEAVGSLVATLSGSDADGSEFTFHLLNIEHKLAYSLDAESGLLAVRTSPTFKVTQQSMKSGSYCQLLPVALQETNYPYQYSTENIEVCVESRNENVPMFSAQEYLIKVPSNATSGYIVTTLEALDSDYGPNSELTFHVNQISPEIPQFFIEGTNLILTTPDDHQLEGGMSELVIGVSDGGMPVMSSSSVFKVVFVSPAPVQLICSQNKYFKLIEENKPTGTFIVQIETQIVTEDLTVLATSTNAEYRIASVEPLIAYQSLEIDFESGDLFTTDISFDFETFQTVSVEIEVEDTLSSFHDLSVTCSVELSIIDLNDNPPVFENPAGVTLTTTKENGDNVPLIYVFTEESTPVSTTLFQLSNFIRDADASVDSELTFEVVAPSADESSSASQLLSVSSSGVVSNKKILVCENIKDAFIEVNIVVRDAENPNLNSEAVFIIVILDSANDFMPLFESESYFWPVVENRNSPYWIGNISALDSDCSFKQSYLRTLETSADHVRFFDSTRYFLIDRFAETVENVSKREYFKVNPLTGEIFVVAPLNFEATPVLEAYVLAVNGLTSLIFAVEFTFVVVDVNEAPQFPSKWVNVTVTESAVIGLPIMSVQAIDPDISEEFSQFHYKISESVQTILEIDSQGGIENLRSMDRETLGDSLMFVVEAVDNQYSNLSDRTNVYIEILDVNDNAPDLTGEFVQNRILYVEENTPAGFVLASLDSIGDLDGPQNAAPFEVILKDAEYSKYMEIEGLEIKTTEVFDREEFTSITFEIEISDSGIPKQTSSFDFTLLVLDQNDNPSYSKHWDVDVVTFRGQDNNFVVGSLYPYDSDSSSNVFSCKDVNYVDHQTSFEVSQTCDLLVGTLDGNETNLVQYRVNDGLHSEVLASARMELYSLALPALESSVFFRVANINTDTFLQHHKQKMISSIKHLWDAEAVIAYMWYVETDGSLLLLVTFVEKELIVVMKSIDQKLNAFEILSQLSVLEVNFNPCEVFENEICGEGARCSFVLEASPTERVRFESEDVLVNTDKLSLEFSCEGDTPKICDVRERDSFLKCLNGGVCSSNSDACECLPGFKGESCELQSSDDTRKCLNGDYCPEERSVCSDTNDEVGFRCLCAFPYSGLFCEQTQDPCSVDSNPCQNGAHCSSTQQSAFHCDCPYGFVGDLCEKTTVGLQRNSSVVLPTLWHRSREDEKTFSIQITFSTLQLDGLLLVDYSPTSTSEVGGFFLELINGFPRFVAKPSNEQSVEVQSEVFCADAEFHSVRVTFDGADELVLNVDSCIDCLKSKNAPSLRNLQTFSEDVFLFVAGLTPTQRNGFVEFPYMWPYSQVSSLNFVGCISELIINNVDVDIHDYANAESHLGDCPRKQSVYCDESFCAEKAQCKENWDENFVCECLDTYSGPSCEQGIESLSFSGSSAVLLRIVPERLSLLALPKSRSEESDGRSKRSASPDGLESASPEDIEIRLSFAQLDSTWRTIVLYNLTNGSSFAIKVSSSGFLVTQSGQSWPVSFPPGGLTTSLFYTLKIAADMLTLNDVTIAVNEHWTERPKVYSPLLNTLMFGSTQNGVRGCVLWAKLDGLRVVSVQPSASTNDLFTPTFVSGSEQLSQMPNCDRFNFCSNTSCLPNLTCISLVDGFQCSDFSACEEHLCNHGTTCIPDGNVPSIDYECDCRLNFAGQFCQFSLFCAPGLHNCRDESECEAFDSEPFFQCVTQGNSDLNVAVVVVPVITVLMLLVCLILWALGCYVRSRSNLTESESRTQVVQQDTQDKTTPLPDIITQCRTFEVAPGVEVEEGIDESMMNSTVDTFGPRRDNYLYFGDSNFSAMPPTHKGSHLDAWNRNEMALQKIQEYSESSRSRSRLRSKGSSTVYTHQSPDHYGSYAGSTSDVEVYDNQRWDAPGKQKQISNISLTNYLTQPPVSHSQQVSESVNSCPEEMRGYYEALNDYVHQEHFRVPDSYELNSSMAPPVISLDLMETSNFALDDNVLSTRSSYNSSGRNSLVEGTDMDTDFAVQIQSSTLPDLYRESQVQREAMEMRQNVSDHHSDAESVDPKRFYMPNRSFRASLSSNQSSPQSPNLNPAIVLNQLHNFNFEQLAPVFQDLADLPNVPDLEENEDDDNAQSVSAILNRFN